MVKQIDEDRLAAIEQRLDTGDAQFNTLSQKLDSIHRDTAAMKEMFTAWNNARGFISTVHWVVRVGGLALKAFGLIAVVYMSVKGEWRSLINWLK